MIQLGSDRISWGIAVMFGFVLTGPMIGVFAKLVSHALPIGQLVAARFTVQAALLLPLVLILRLAHRPNTREIAQHVARALLLVCATGFFFSALRFMPIADAIAIFFIEPFLLNLLGGFILGEAVGGRRILACMVGFMGALLVIEPKFETIGLPALLPMGTAFFFALYMILTRKMAQKMNAFALQAYTALAAVAVCYPLLFLFDESGMPLLDPSWPSLRDFWLLLAMGIAATIAHCFISFALALAPATIIAPLQYLEIVGAVVAGYLVFTYVPTALTLCGMAMLISSGLFVFYREHQLELRMRRQAVLPVKRN